MSKKKTSNNDVLLFFAAGCIVIILIVTSILLVLFKPWKRDSSPPPPTTTSKAPLTRNQTTTNLPFSLGPTRNIILSCPSGSFIKTFNGKTRRIPTGAYTYDYLVSQVGIVCSDNSQFTTPNEWTNSNDISSTEKTNLNGWNSFSFVSKDVKLDPSTTTRGLTYLKFLNSTNQDTFLVGEANTNDTNLITTIQCGDQMPISSLDFEYTNNFLTNVVGMNCKQSGL